MNPRSYTRGDHADYYTTDEPTIYRTRGDHADYYITDEPTIYRTRGDHADYYTTDEPTIYRTRGDHADYYITDEPTIYRTRGDHADYYTTDAATLRYNIQHNLSKPNPVGTEEFVQFRQLFGLHRFKLHRHLVDGTVKAVWFRQVFGLLMVRFRQVLLYYLGMEENFGSQESFISYIYTKLLLCYTVNSFIMFHPLCRVLVILGKFFSYVWTYIGIFFLKIQNNSLATSGHT